MTQKARRITRADHLEWSKRRARESMDEGDFSAALSGFISDLRKNDETKNHPALRLAALLVCCDRPDTDKVRKYIEGFN